jgi:hypothetical protein
VQRALVVHGDVARVQARRLRRVAGPQRRHERVALLAVAVQRRVLAQVRLAVAARHELHAAVVEVVSSSAIQKEAVRVSGVTGQ